MDFYIVYSITFLNLLICLSSFTVVLQDFCTKIMTVTNREHFTSVFPIQMLFISFSFIPLSRMFNRSGDSGHSYLFPILGTKNLSFH